MNDDVSSVIAKIRSLCKQCEIDKEFTYEQNDELEQLCGILCKHDNVDTWIPLLFELIERFDETVDITLGSPGPIVHCIEERHPHHQKYLLESLERRPTNTACWMAERVARHPEEDKEFWLGKLQDVVKNPNISATLKRDLEIEGKA